MNDSFKIRSARPGDATEVLSMLSRLAKHEGAADQPRLNKDSLEQYVFAASPRAYVFVAESQNGVLMGFILVFETFSSWTGGLALHVGDLWVEEFARRRDVARQLMNHASDAFPNRRIDVYVVRTNDARSFYERCGFVEQEEWVLYRRAAADPRQRGSSGTSLQEKS